MSPLVLTVGFDSAGAYSIIERTAGVERSVSNCGYLHLVAIRERSHRL
jgi:hypothetical protein